jgi:hypothetical protein
MPIYRIPAERPRQSKRFLTARDVEDMAAAHVREVIHTADLVITDAAREVASDLGIKIIFEDGKQPAVSRLPETDTITSAKPIAAQVNADQKIESSFVVESFGPPHVASDGLVRAIVEAIQTRWRPVRRYERQLSGPEKP